ncbi:glycosyltransferase [Patescibacteria group bacterium]
MAKKSILYIITKSVWGGAGKYVYDLSTSMYGDFDVTVAAGGNNTLAQELIKTKIPYFEIKNFQRDINLIKEPIAFIEILCLLFKLKPDIIHVNSSKAGSITGLAGKIYKILSKQQLQMIFTAHGWAFAEDRPKITIAIIKFLSKITCLFYDKIICVSEYDRQIAINNNIAPINKLIAIHNGIDIKNLKFLDKEKARQKLLKNSSAGGLVLGTIAEWHKNKGLFYFLKAMENIDPPADGINIVLIGSGENRDKEKLYQYIKENNLKNIYLHEFIPNAASYLKALDIFILPSVKEGLPYTILETIAAEIPIIATNVGGIPEILNKDYLVNPKNSQQLTEKINYVINNLTIIKEKIQGTATNNKDFSSEKMVQKTKNIYNALTLFRRYKINN